MGRLAGERRWLSAQSAGVGEKRPRLTGLANWPRYQPGSTGLQLAINGLEFRRTRFDTSR